MYYIQFYWIHEYNYHNLGMYYIHYLILLENDLIKEYQNN